MSHSKPQIFVFYGEVTRDFVYYISPIIVSICLPTLPDYHHSKSSSQNKKGTCPSNPYKIHLDQLKLATIDVVGNQPLLQQWPPKLANLTLS